MINISNEQCIAGLMMENWVELSRIAGNMDLKTKATKNGCVTLK